MPHSLLLSFLLPLVMVAGWDQLALLCSFSFPVQATTISLVDVRRMDAIVMGLLETGRFPVSFYRGLVRAALTVIIPVAFMTTFPAEALLGRLDRWLAVMLFVLASAFWRFALRYYTGASS